MRCALAVPPLTVIFVLVLAAVGFAQPSQTPALDPGVDPAVVGQAPADLPAQAPAIPEPPAGTKAPANMDTPPAFTQRPVIRQRTARPDLTFAQRPAPVDFRGMAWGADLSNQSGLLPVTKPVTLPGTYFRSDELLRLGQAELRSVAGASDTAPVLLEPAAPGLVGGSSEDRPGSNRRRLCRLGLCLGAFPPGPRPIPRIPRRAHAEVQQPTAPRRGHRPATEIPPHG